MKIPTILFVLTLGMVAAAPAQTFNPERKFKEGSTEAYTMTMQMTSSMGELTLNMDTTQTVKKVYENGDADVETAVTAMVMNMGGSEFKPPAGKPTVMRLNKYGLPVANDKSRGMNFNQFGTYFGEKEMTVGETYTFETVDKANPKTHSKGTAKLVSIENGVAKLQVSVDSWTPASEKPMHMDGTATVDASTHALIRFEGKATDMPGMGGPGMTISTATFTIARKG